MAKKKSRVPTPPAPRPKSSTAAPPRRPVQAPKVRTKGRPRPRPSVLWLALAGAGIVALGVVVGVIVLTRGGGSSSADVGPNTNIAATMRAAGCTYKEAQPLPFTPNHSLVPTLATPVKWNTFPPAAGEHYGTPAIWDFYRGPVNPRQVVHNEEHGGVVLWYGPKTPKRTVDALNRFYQEEPDSMIGTQWPDNAPGISFVGLKHPTLGSKVAITAWTIDSYRNYFKHGDLGTGIVSVCPTFDEKAFAAFRDTYRGNGPEFPKAYSLRINKPGT